jgi:uncharacterized protein (DUF849 family)
MPLSVAEVVDEGVACAAEGAAIVHYHAYDPETRRTNDRDLDFHRRVLEGIRSRCDAIVYPTTTMRRLGQPSLAGERFSVEQALAREGLLEWFVLDPGSTNMVHASRLAGGFVYVNEVEELVQGYALAREEGLSPVVAVFELGFARLGRTIAAEVAGGPDPAVYRVMFSDGFSFGLPPSSGADLRVGLEDAPRGSDRSNVELVREAASRLTSAGVDLAAPDDVRRELRPGVGR